MSDLNQFMLIRTLQMGVPHDIPGLVTHVRYFPTFAAASEAMKADYWEHICSINEDLLIELNEHPELYEKIDFGKDIKVAQLYPDWAFIQIDEETKKDELQRSITSWQIVVANSGMDIGHDIVG